MRVCVLRVEFLEDFTDSTTGNGKFDLQANPPHDRAYFEDLADRMENYFHGVSGGRLVVRCAVFPGGAREAYTVPHQMPYYGADDDYMIRLCEFFRDAVESADPEVDYSAFDAVIVAHAGAGQEADVLCDSPHDLQSIFVRYSDLIAYLPGAGSGFQGISTNDGVYVREGSLIPEQETQDGYGLGVLGTMCHEFGHQLGLPDLYDTMEGTVGIGGWGLMGYGQWMMSGFWPSGPCAWSRKYLQWVEEVVADGEGTFELSPGDTVLKVPLTGTEYLLVENRQRDPNGNGMNDVDEYDYGLRGSGILIWHVDQGLLQTAIAYNTVNVDPDHKGVDLEEADGIQDFDYSLPDIYGYEGSEYDPWFVEGYAWLFGPETEPSSATSWGGNTWVTVEVLDPSGNDMRVKVSRGNVEQGWPLQWEPALFGPLVWDPPGGGGKRLVLTASNGTVSAFSADGSDRVPMGISVSAPPVCGDPGVGDEHLLVCGEDGTLNLRDLSWNQPPGWPVNIGQRPRAALMSERLGVVCVSTDQAAVYVVDDSGMLIPGWPVNMDNAIRGISVFPDQEHPGIAVSTAEGRVHLLSVQGSAREGWPVAPGDEPVSRPVCADVNRDGLVDVAVISGDRVFVYDSFGNLLAGFPAVLPAPPLGSPGLADLNGDGLLEVVVETEDHVVAVECSGSTLTDWPRHEPGDSLGFGYSIGSRPAGGRGFALVGLRDGRISLYDGSGNQPWPYPLSVGDWPIGSPLMVDLDEDGEEEVIAVDGDGYVCCWTAGYEPQGWHMGLDHGGEGCWWSDLLPPLSSAEGLLSEGSFYVYPNPVTTGTGTVRFEPGYDCSWQVRVFNVAGELVSHYRGNAPGGAPWEVTWKTEDLSPGVYFVCLELDSSQGSDSALFQAAVVN
jgi:M6 family metalloprotease-like protein